MTRLRKMMLEELQAVITCKIPHATTSAQSKILLGDSTARRTVWVLGTFANIRLSCFRNGSCRRVQ